MQVQELAEEVAASSRRADAIEVSAGAAKQAAADLEQQLQGVRTALETERSAVKDVRRRQQGSGEGRS